MALPGFSFPRNAFKLLSDCSVQRLGFLPACPTPKAEILLIKKQKLSNNLLGMAGKEDGLRSVHYPGKIPFPAEKELSSLKKSLSTYSSSLILRFQD